MNIRSVKYQKIILIIGSLLSLLLLISLVYLILKNNNEILKTIKSNFIFIVFSHYIIFVGLAFLAFYALSGQYKLLNINSKLEQQKSLLTGLLNSIPDIIFFKDKRGKYLGSNRSFAEFVGKPEDKIIGKTDNDLFSEEVSAFYKEEDKKTMELNQPMLKEEWIEYKDRRRVLVETIKSPLYGANNEIIGLLGISRDITERKNFEQELILKDKLLSAVARATYELVKNQDFGDAIIKSFEVIGDTIDIDRIYLFENSFDREMNRYVTSQKYEWVSSSATPQIDNHQLQNLPFSEINFFVRQLIENKPIITMVKDLDQQMKNILEPEDILSIMIFPIFVEGRFWGFVGFDECKIEKIWPEAEQAILFSFASSLAGVIERNEKRKKEKENEKKVSNILDNMRDGIITINENCIIESCNPAVEKIFGYDQTEIIGKKLSLLVPHLCSNSEKPVFCQNTCFLKKDNLLCIPELAGRKKNNVNFPIEIDFTRIDNEEKNTYLLVLRDITQRREIDRMKNEFISTVSHELRTPLTSICGSLDLISTGIFGQMPDEAKELLKIASESSTRLIELINDILDIEKIEAGKMEFHFEILDLMTIVEQAVEENQAYAQKFNIDLEIESSISDIKVSADKNRVIQVITNLLSNAVKFSPPKSKVKISVSSQDKYAKVEVIDKGPGIPEEFQGQIFEKFAQADSSDSRQKGGTGLGLSICKAIIQRLGGSISYTTSKSGTVFYFDLPISDNTKLIRSYTINKARILICEDDEYVAKLISHLLDHNGYETEIAYNAEQAKEMLAESQFDALTVDLILPNQSGISLIRELRESDNNIPVIVVSIKANEVSEEVDGNLAVIDWINKPIDHNKLLSSISRAISVNVTNKPYILHIEDDIDIQKVVSSILQNNAIIRQARDLKVAKEFIKSESFDLVILDVEMPDGSGLDILPLITNNDKRSIPVLILSSQEINEDIAAKVDAVLTKSKAFSKEFINAVDELINFRNKQRNSQ